MKEIEKFSFRIPIELKTEVKKISKIKGYPMNTVLLQFAWQGIEEFYKERGR